MTAAVTTTGLDGGGPESPADRCPCCGGLTHAASQGSAVLSARMWFSIRRRYAPARSIESMRVLVVEDEPYMGEAIRDGLRLEAIAASQSDAAAAWDAEYTDLIEVTPDR